MVTQKLYDSGEAAVVGTASISGTVTEASINDNDNAQIAGDFNKYLVEQGSKLFSLTLGNIDGSSANGVRNCLLLINTGYAGRFKFNIQGSSDMDFIITEAPTVTSSGALATWYDLNRTVKGAAHCSFYNLAVLATTGPTLFRKYITDAVGQFVIDNLALPAGTLYSVSINPHAIGTFSLEALLHETTV